MQRDDLLVLLDELFERPPNTLRGPERLDELGNWDSMAVMGLIAMADKHCQVTLSPRQFANCRTIDDLLQVVGAAA